MSQDEIVAGIRAVLEDVGFAADRVTAQARLKEDLDIDSLALAEITLSLEDQFGIELPEEEVTDDLKTVGDVARLIQTKRPTAA